MRILRNGYIETPEGSTTPVEVTYYILQAEHAVIIITKQV